MKRISSIISAVLALFLIASCQPVVEKELVREPVSSGTVTHAVAAASSSDARDLEVKFDPVPGATEYRVKVSEAPEEGEDLIGIPEQDITILDSDYYSGYFHAIATDLIPGWRYDVEILAKNSLNTDYVSVYHQIAELPEAVPSDADKPASRLSMNNSKTELTVTFMTEAGFRYLVSITESGETAYLKAPEIIEGNGREATVRFQTDPEGSYDVVILYAYISASDEDLIAGTGDGIGRDVKSIDLGEYDGNLRISYDSASGTFVVTGVTSTDVDVFVGTNVLGGLHSKALKASGERAEVKSSDFLEPLDHGAFYAFTVDASNNHKRSTQYVDFIEPIDDEDIASDVRWQTASISWGKGSTAVLDTRKSTVTVTETAGPSLPRNPDKGSIDMDDVKLTADGVEIANLDSNTSYEVTISLILSDGYEYTITEDITTRSFAGSYAWVCPAGIGNNDGKCKDFRIVVTDGTSTAYTIHSDIDDSYNTADKPYKLFPLVDGTVDSPIDFNTPVSSQPYGEANEAYTWNYKKWSIDSVASMATLETWLPKSTLNVRDSAATEVVTKTNMASATTNTSWVFRENDEHQAEIVFTNKGNSLAALGMYKGPDNSVFVLSRTGEAGV